MFEQEQARQLELSEYQTPAKRSLALWTATAWIALAMAEAIVILARHGSAMNPAGRWALAAGMTLLGFIGWPDIVSAAGWRNSLPQIRTSREAGR